MLGTRVSRRIATAVLFSLVGIEGAHATVIYVDADAIGAGNGTSWVDAFVALQDALAAATGGSELWVAEGTYEPDVGAAQTPGSRASTFQLIAGVALYGGFAGTETSRDERDPALHPTTLSGDLAGNDQPAWVNHSENCYHVVSAAGVDSTAKLDGFTVYGGYAEVSSGWDGAAGGLLLQGASPTIANCRFRENLSHGGGAMGAFPGSPHVSRCTFEGNYAWTGRGGAVYNDTGSNPSFTDCVFRGNDSWGASGVGDGGAMFNSSGTAVRLTRCVFVDNTSSAFSPPYSNGGALCNLGDGLTVMDCAFYGNDAIQAGGVWTGGDASFVNTVFSGNTALFGGGVVLFLSTTTFVNCDFSRNDAEDGGGIALGFQATALIRNCVLWGNTATQAPSDFKAQVHKADETAATDFRYSVVQGIFTPEPGEDPPDPANFPGCSEADPLFADADGADNVAGTEDDDFALQAGSPCVDAAENATVPPGTVTDFAGAPRFFDDPCATDTGLGTPPIVDMGALEFPTSSCANGVELASSASVAAGELFAAPNPFRGVCRIAFRLGTSCAVTIEIVDVAGRRVRHLAEAEWMPAGSHALSWDGRGDDGRALAAGVYFVRADAGDGARTEKILLLR
jgi:hypothetical protein